MSRYFSGLFKQRPSGRNFTWDWHFWNVVSVATPAALIVYIMSGVKRDVQEEMARKGINVGSAPPGSAATTNAPTPSPSSKGALSATPPVGVARGAATEQQEQQREQREFVKAENILAEMQERIAALESTLTMGLRKPPAAADAPFVKLKVQVPKAFKPGQLLRLRHQGVTITIDAPADAEPGGAFIFKLPRRTVERLQRMNRTDLDLSSAASAAAVSAVDARSPTGPEGAGGKEGPAAPAVTEEAGDDDGNRRRRRHHPNMRERLQQRGRRSGDSPEPAAAGSDQPAPTTV